MVLDTRIARWQVGDPMPVMVRSAASMEDADAPIVEEDTATPA